MDFEEGPVELNVGNVCEGAVPELFMHEVKKVLANIADLNTDPEATRSVTLKFKFKPSPDRKAAIVSFSAESKLAGVNPVAGSVFFSKQLGEVRAFTEDPRQEKLFAKTAAASPSQQ